jgi:hypothetical protein
MMDCLYAQCTPYITDCVMAELEKLGPKFRVALRVAKDKIFERLPCSHSGTYADDCLCDRVSQHQRQGPQAPDSQDPWGADHVRRQPPLHDRAAAGQGRRRRRPDDEILAGGTPAARTRHHDRGDVDRATAMVPTTGIPVGGKELSHIQTHLPS